MFSWKYFASLIAAYSAKKKNDNQLAREVWESLLLALTENNGLKGFEAEVYATDWQGRDCLEIPWITTNVAAQLGKNIIICLELIRDGLPQTLAEVDVIRSVSNN